MTSSTEVPRWATAALSIAESCFLSPEKLRPTNVAPSWMARRQVSIAGSSFTTPALGGRAGVGGGAELPLGQAVHPVVLDDVDQREVSSDQVDELPDSDRGGVPVTGDAQAHQAAVGQQRPGGDRRHPSVHRVEGVGTAHEIGRGLRRAADAGELGHPFGGNAQLEHRLEDALADGVVTAPGAEGGLSALVVGLGEPDAVGLLGHGQRPSRAAISSVTLRASRGSPGMWATDFSRGSSSTGRSSLSSEAIWPSRFCSTTYTRW